MITRREFTGAAAGFVMSGARAAETRPNIIFLLTDDQRWDALGCTGNSIIRTPHIDRLSREGVTFQNCFVTSAICMTSRASMFTGLHERTHGISSFSLPLAPEVNARSYPELLRGAGYIIEHRGMGAYCVVPGDLQIVISQQEAEIAKLKSMLKNSPRSHRS